MSELEWLDAFSDNLRNLLSENGMTQRDLAEEIRVEESTISRYVRGQRMPTVINIVNMAYALNCSTEDLLDFGETIN